MTETIPETILIVEDDPCISEMLQTFFKDQGATVLVAMDGRNINNMVRSGNPDIIILDVILPYRDGMTVLAELRREGLMTPVIMLTERSQVEDKIQGLEVGADDYVTKPFSPRELLARVQAQLRRSRSAAPAAPQEGVLTVGSLKVDRQAREAELGGAPVKLTKTEFDLLLYMAERQGQAVSHGDLLSKVLGYEPQTETKALVMHIANLRRKIDDSGHHDIRILAVTGVGYRLESGPANGTA